MNRRLFLAGAAAVTASGCFGKFALTQKLWGWNDSFGSKFVSTLVFWVLCIIPVYAVVGFIDIWVLNLIEFWTGSNPLSEVEHEDGSKTRFARLAPDTVRVTRVTSDGATKSFDLVLVGEGAAQARAVDGTVLVTQEARADGSMVTTTPEGRTELDAKLVRELAKRERIAEFARPLLEGGALASR